jgi:hypothetical protein
MEKRQQYKLDGLTGSQVFLDAPEAGLGVLKNTEARRQLDAAVEEVRSHQLGQREAENARLASKTRKVALARELREQHMKPIAQFARAKLSGAPDFAALSDSGRNLRGGELVAAARAMAIALEPLADVLVEAQFPADVVTQLAAAAQALENTLRDYANNKSARHVATSSLAQHLTAGRRAVMMLDAVVTKRLAGNEGLLEGWRQAKRVVMVAVRPPRTAANVRR